MSINSTRQGDVRGAPFSRGFSTSAGGAGGATLSAGLIAVFAWLAFFKPRSR